MTDKLEETDEGYYEQVGDVREWRWKEGHEPKVTVPEGDFDPLSANPKPEPKPKVNTTKSAAPIAKKAKAKE